MNHMGSRGVVIADVKVWTNSKTIERKLRDELGRKNIGKETGIHRRGRSWKEAVEESIKE